MSDDLFLRLTVIGGETKPDDYQVIWDGLSIGRIQRSVGINGASIWQWSAGLGHMPQPPRHRGRANSLNEAKAAFKQAWDEIRPDLTYDDIRQARDDRDDRSRPWHR